MKIYYVIFSLVAFSVFITSFEFEPKKIHAGVTQVKNKSLSFQDEIRKTLNEDIVTQDIGIRSYTTYQLMTFTIKNPIINEKLEKLGLSKISKNKFCRNGELIQINEEDDNKLEGYVLSWSFPEDECAN